MIRIGIVGYGNLGKGVELAISQNEDMKLVAVFSRRELGAGTLKSPDTKLLHISKAPEMQNEIDVMILCGGSATDLPEQGPMFARLFNTVDSFDTHAKIPAFYEAMDEAAKAGNNVAIISAGWDPGLFSMNRVLADAVLPKGNGYTFWGKGVSQGHSDAIRRVKGVKYGVQYTVPKEEALQKVRSGENPRLSTRQMHLRDCYVVAEDGADKRAIEEEIRNMPNYFADYDTKVTFISEDEFFKNHTAMPHGGFVMRSGITADNSNHIVEFSLKLDSNPMFTASVLVAFARAAYKLSREGHKGAKTVLDIPLAYLSPKTPEQLRKEFI
ncbi:MAG TPA: diaminopimelate dehydrogenase [Clostridiaceae bacterium]|nr:diaminopimelate dehydrogenase [Clostridiaceae bacterium]